MTSVKARSVVKETHCGEEGRGKQVGKIKQLGLYRITGVYIVGMVRSQSGSS